MSSIVPIVSGSTAASGSSVAGTGTADAPGGFDPLQHLPSFRSVAAHAIGGAVGGVLGGPMGMLGGAALSVVGAFVEAAIAPGTSAPAAATVSGTTAGLTAPGNSGASAQANAPAGQAGAGLTLGTASNDGSVSGIDGNLARRALAALNAYDRTMQNGAVAPGQILA